MKKIKIKYVGFWPGFEPDAFFITRILRQHYQVEISDDPDYILCSCFGFYEYLGYPQVRIMFSGENYIPDFNYVDYALSVYPVDFLDRHFSYPGMILASYDNLFELNKKNRNYPASILEEKKLFANMIASHESEKKVRGQLMELLSRYRRVEAAGSYLNNMLDGKAVQMSDGSKFALQNKCKFTLCGESVSHEGFVTEKIFDAFLADTIPVYFGSSTVSAIFNKRAYIDVRDFNSLQDVADYIIALDQDDGRYLEMLRQHIFCDEHYVEKSIARLETFLCNIFDQPVAQAYRRCRLYAPGVYEQKLVDTKNKANNFDLKHRWSIKNLIENFAKHR